jgi:hypothetical protein
MDSKIPSNPDSHHTFCSTEKKCGTYHTIKFVVCVAQAPSAVRCSKDQFYKEPSFNPFPPEWRGLLPRGDKEIVSSAYYSHGNITENEK